MQGHMGCTPGQAWGELRRNEGLAVPAPQEDVWGLFEGFGAGGEPKLLPGGRAGLAPGPGKRGH